MELTDVDSLSGVSRAAEGVNRSGRQLGGTAKVVVITAQIGVIRGIRHLKTFGGGKIAVRHGRALIKYATPLLTLGRNHGSLSK